MRQRNAFHLTGEETKAHSPNGLAASGSKGEAGLEVSSPNFPPTRTSHGATQPVSSEGGVDSGGKPKLQVCHLPAV